LGKNKPPKPWEIPVLLMTKKSKRKRKKQQKYDFKQKIGINVLQPCGNIFEKLKKKHKKQGNRLETDIVVDDAAFVGSEFHHFYHSEWLLFAI
jgi:hypothetical protein